MKVISAGRMELALPSTSAAAKRPTALPKSAKALQREKRNRARLRDRSDLEGIYTIVWQARQELPLTLNRLGSAFILGYHGCDRRVGEPLLRGDLIPPKQQRV